MNEYLDEDFNASYTEGESLLLGSPLWQGLDHWLPELGDL